MIKKILILSFVLSSLIACGGNGEIREKQEKRNIPETTYLNLDFEDLVGKGVPKYWQLYRNNCTVSGDKTLN